MELKRDKGNTGSTGDKAFNRTSMELKPNLGKAIFVKFTLLLIEPVWNWNFDAAFERKRVVLPLLIEPVWNWNLLSEYLAGMVDAF